MIYYTKQQSSEKPGRASSKDTQMWHDSWHVDTDLVGQTSVS